jgi:4-hydroxybenzoate polyprenyltransferase/phosphoserine phosphatase
MEKATRQVRANQNSQAMTSSDGNIPLCVDLDGTLILSDVLWESIARLWTKPSAGFRALFALRKGKAALKAALSDSIPIAADSLPYREDLVAWLRAEHASGRQLILATATHEDIARRVADYLGIFLDILATKDKRNLGGASKRDALVAAYGEKGFDYVGDSMKDLPVIASARVAYLADPSRRLEERAGSVSTVGKVFRRARNWPKVILKTMRLHQWSKNALLGVPLVASHRVLDRGSWASLMLAFVSFSLLASATYIVNDLHDLPVDRKHAKKRFRPLASGDMPIPFGLTLVLLLAIASVAMTWTFLSRRFLLSMVAYVVFTLAYSFTLKRRLILDALTLAVLYTLRIIAGAAAIGVDVTEWLLMFSLFIFVSLALLKRYIELSDASVGKIPGRGYMPTDIEVILSIGPTSGLMSVLVLALYINSPSVNILYRVPQVLWLLCPLMIYWICRIWFLAKRGEVNQDPIVFALTDKHSFAVAFLAALIMLLASTGLGLGLGI